MSLQYSRGLLRVVIAQLCRQLGWNAIHSSPLELLTSILERYIVQLGRQTHRFSELCMYMTFSVRVIDEWNHLPDSIALQSITDIQKAS